MRDDRSGSDYQAVYSAALHVEQASLVRDDDELHKFTGLNKNQWK